MFVCHGNICRSPMAEFIMKNLVRDGALQGEFHIESAATSSEETGNDIYPRAASVLSRHNVAYTSRRARRFTLADYDKFDMVVVMEEYNIKNIMRIIGCDSKNKVWKLLDFTNDNVQRCCGDDISDPWYHGDFEKTYNEILSGCNALLKYCGY